MDDDDWAVGGPPPGVFVAARDMPEGEMTEEQRREQVFMERLIAIVSGEFAVHAVSESEAEITMEDGRKFRLLVEEVPR
jgi:hypothetical protein